MPQNVRYKVNIAGFLIQGCAICTAEFMGRYFFGSCDLAGVLFDHIFDCLHAHTFTLSRVEESMFMSGERSDTFAYLQIAFQSFFNFFTKINNHFVATFSGDFNSIIFKIYIFNIKTDTFRYTDSGAEKKRDDCQVTFLCFFVIYTFLTGQAVSTVLDIVQKQRNFICIQADNAFVMDFRDINQDSRVCVDHFTFIIISIKTAQSRNFAL